MIATVSTVRAAYVDLRMFINYHLNCGVDRMFLFFDDANDGSITKFKQNERLTCIRCDSAHWSASQVGDLSSLEARQVYNASLALEICRGEGIEWLLHIDVDELIYTPQYSISKYLQGVEERVDAITFSTLEAVAKKRYAGHVFQEIKWFKTAESIIPYAGAAARMMGCRRVFEYGYFRGHAIGKTATRVLSPAVGGIGVHLPIGLAEEKLYVARSPDAYTLHFDGCTFEDWKQKWMSRYRRTAVVPRMSEGRRRQLADFVAAYEHGSEALLLAAYERQCVAPTFEKVILFSVGLLRRIKVNKNFFLDK